MENNWSVLTLQKETMQEYVSLTAEHTLHTALENKEKGCAIGLKTAENLPIGAAVAVFEGDQMQITSFFVEESFREQGAGRALLQEMTALAEQKGCRQIQAAYAFPKQRDLQGFFLAEGFRFGENEKHIFQCPMEVLRAFVREHEEVFPANGEIRTYSALTPLQKSRWVRRMGKTIPLEYTPAKVSGTPIHEASLVYVQDDTVRGYTACTMLGERTAHLGLLYLDKDAESAGHFLVYETLSRLSEADADTFCMTVSTELELRMMRSVCAELLEQMEEQVIYNMVLQTGGTEEMLHIDFTQVGFTPLLPRLNALQEMLEELELESQLVLSTETAPFLLLEEEGNIWRLSYLAVQPEEAGRYLLMITTEVPVEDMEHAEMHRMRCLVCNRISVGSFAEYDEEEGKFSVRCMLPETGGMVSMEQLAFVLDLFRDAVNHLKAAE